MDPPHDLSRSINIAPVDETNPIYSEINIDILSSSVLPVPKSILSSGEPVNETVEFDDPFDFNIVIIQSDEETDTVVPNVDPVTESDTESNTLPEIPFEVKPKVQSEDQLKASSKVPPKPLSNTLPEIPFEVKPKTPSKPLPKAPSKTQPTQPAKWRQDIPFNHDFSYGYLSILPPNALTGSAADLQRALQMRYSANWCVSEKPLGQGANEVTVENEQHIALMRLRLFNRKLHGLCSFWSDNGTIEGEWKNGECVWKTILYGQNKFKVTYKNELPDSVEDLVANPPTLYEYRDGFFTGRKIYGRWLYVKEVIQGKEVETISSTNRSFCREGKAFMYESNQLKRLGLYSNDIYMETLRLYEENTVKVMRGSVCVYKGSYDPSFADGPVTGFGEIYENGNVYRGAVVSGIPYGRGEYIVNNKPFYRGDFRYGVPHGKGILGEERYEDSFLFGYRLSSGVSFREHFGGLVIQELCGHLMFGNSLDVSKMKKVFPEYDEDCKIWDQYWRDIEKKKNDEMTVKRRSQEVARMKSQTLPMGSCEGASQNSTGNGDVRNQRMSFGSGSMSTGMESRSMNQPSPVNPTIYPAPSFPTDSTFTTDSFAFADSTLLSPPTNLPYRNSSVSPMTPTPPTPANNLFPPFSFNEYSINTNHFNSFFG